MNNYKGYINKLTFYSYKVYYPPSKDKVWSGKNIKLSMLIDEEGSENYMELETPSKKETIPLGCLFSSDKYSEYVLVYKEENLKIYIQVTNLSGSFYTSIKTITKEPIDIEERAELKVITKASESSIKLEGCYLNLLHGGIQGSCVNNIGSLKHEHEQLLRKYNYRLEPNDIVPLGLAKAYVKVSSDVYLIKDCYVGLIKDRRFILIDKELQPELETVWLELSNQISIVIKDPDRKHSPLILKTKFSDKFFTLMNPEDPDTSYYKKDPKHFN